MTLMITVVALSYSRSAALVAVVAVGAWVAFVPLRLRSALMIGLAGACATPIVLVALHDRNLTTDHVSLAAQDAAGHAFGPPLLGITLVAAALGVAASLAMARVTVPQAVRRRIGVGLIGIAAAVPVAAVVALAASSRGLSGQLSHAWHSLVSTQSVVRDTPGRLTQLGSSRPLYWQQGLDVGSHALLKGVGELGFGVARLRYTTSTLKADQAHNYLVQTFADLGILGVLVTLALLAAWCRATMRSLAVHLRWRELSVPEAAERQGLAALAIVVLTFGIQSLLDFTFYFPGITITALLSAGWLAGRGPLSAPVGRRQDGRVSPLERPGAGALVTGLAAVALIGAWVMWQPLRSAQALADAENHPQTAFASALTAANRDPLSIEPPYLLYEFYRQSGDNAAARAELVKATQIQPENPQSWLRLGELDATTGRPQAAVTELRLALALDRPSSPAVQIARAALAQSQAQLAEQRTARHRAARRRADRARSRRRRAQGA